MQAYGVNIRIRDNPDIFYLNGKFLRLFGIKLQAFFIDIVQALYVVKPYVKPARIDYKSRRYLLRQVILKRYNLLLAYGVGHGYLEFQCFQFHRGFIGFVETRRLQSFGGAYEFLAGYAACLYNQVLQRADIPLYLAQYL